MDKEQRRRQAEQGVETRRQQAKREESKEQSLSSAKGHGEKASQAKDTAIERLEGGQGNPVDRVLYERQKQILENQKAIMAELGIGQE